MVSEQYNFSDFTEDHYRSLLTLAKQNFKFIGFNEVKQAVEKKERVILWRHDLDFSIHRAYRLAEIEHECGIRATYFIHFHNEFYNLLEKEIVLLIKKIIELGHTIGLHFDTHFYNIEDVSSLEEYLVFEKQMVKKIFNVDVEVFSFHNTTPFTMSCQNWTYGGLINTYASFFQKEAEYCSDSNGYWRYNRLYDVLNNTTAQTLQVLTHPEWWQEMKMSPWEKIQRCVAGRADKNLTFYKKHLKAFNMKNIDWDGEVSE